MKLEFSPVRADRTLVLERDGEALIINGTRFDLAQIAEGAVVEPDTFGGDWFVGPVMRVDGVLHVTLMHPHGPLPVAGAADAVPLPGRSVLETVPDGPVSLPPMARQGARGNGQSRA